MARISGLSDELLVKILSFLPTEVAVSTSVLSKQWEFLWMWLPNLRFDLNRSNSPCIRDFIAKNLPLHRAPIIESLCLSFSSVSLQPEDLKSWVGIAVSRCVRELSIDTSTDDKSYKSPNDKEPAVSLPSSLYTCKSLVTLKLEGQTILVDVPRTVCLPSLKTLRLGIVKYSNDESLRLLLSYCPVLEDLFINRDYYDSLRKLVIIVPSLQRLTLCIDQRCSSDGYVIVTPSLKYFDVDDYRSGGSCLIEHMPELEEAYISLMADDENFIEKLFKSITTVKRLTIRITWNSGKETVYRDRILFTQLENLKLYICSENWSQLLVQLLKDSPNLQILNLLLDQDFDPTQGVYKPVRRSNNKGSVPECFLNSLETFKFEGYNSQEQEDRDFLSFIFKHARCLKTSILNRRCHGRWS